MAINKVEYAGNVLIDLTADTVATETLAEGVTAHDASGAPIVGTMKSGSGGGELPEGYTRCDYIQFSGSQWVDTGIVGNQDTQVNVSFTWENSTQRHLFGCASSDNTASITSYTNGSWRFGSKSATKTIMKNNTLLPYTARINNTMIGVTGSNTNISDVADFETPDTLLLGGARNGSGALPSSGIVGRVFYFYLWQGETRVLKLVPVVDADGNYYFFDEISKRLFDSITDTPLDGGTL